MNSIYEFIWPRGAYRVDDKIKNISEKIKNTLRAAINSQNMEEICCCS